jgi:vancomycin permeability regulator SanA
MLSTIARGLALFLGGFTLLNLAGDLRFAGADANLWWIDFWPLPLTVSRLLLVALAGVLIAWAVKPESSPARRLVAVALASAALLAAAGNVIRYYLLLQRGAIHSSIPIPFSLLITAALLAILTAQFRPVERCPRVFAVAFVVAGIAFPLAQISLFGTTDYRRPADLIVVFGARAFADGTASEPLAERVRTGCALYHAGLGRQLLFSGGPGEGAVDEPEAMARLAVTLGVPSPAILRDSHGINTEATVRNTAALLHGRPLQVLMVSHFYHLPRIKMTCQRYGIDAYTVPAETSAPRGMAINLAREDLAFWAYYLRRFR